MYAVVARASYLPVLAVNRGIGFVNISHVSLYQSLCKIPSLGQFINRSRTELIYGFSAMPSFLQRELITELPQPRPSSVRDMFEGRMRLNLNSEEYVRNVKFDFRA